MKSLSLIKVGAVAAAALGLGVFLAASAVLAAPAPAGAPPAAAPAAKKLTVDSNFGQLVDNPVTNAVIKKLAPALLANKTFLGVGRDISLRAMAQYDESLTADKLKEIDAALAQAQAQSTGS